MKLYVINICFFVESAICMHAQSCLTLWTPWTVACQALLFMEFSRQEYWSGQPFHFAGDLTHSGIEPGSPALQADSLLSEPPGQPSLKLQCSVSPQLKLKLTALMLCVFISVNILIIHLLWSVSLHHSTTQVFGDKLLAFESLPQDLFLGEFRLTP